VLQRIFFSSLTHSPPHSPHYSFLTKHCLRHFSSSIPITYHLSVSRNARFRLSVFFVFLVFVLLSASHIVIMHIIQPTHPASLFYHVFPIFLTHLRRRLDVSSFHSNSCTHYPLHMHTHAAYISHTYFHDLYDPQNDFLPHIFQRRQHFTTPICTFMTTHTFTIRSAAHQS